MQPLRAAADRAVGLWLAQMSASVPDDFRNTAPVHQSASDPRALRALVRASATAYARRLRDAGATPERMVVLVKEAAGRPSTVGLAVQELMSDMVRWSIEAYFDE